MKRSIFSVIAVALALTFSAFTAAPNKSKATNYTFVFDYANFLPSQANVQSDAAWLESSGGSCPTTDNQEACRITVNETKTHLDGAERKLNTGILIPVAQYMSTGKYFVNAGSDVISRVNQHQ